MDQQWTLRVRFTDGTHTDLDVEDDASVKATAVDGMIVVLGQRPGREETAELGAFPADTVAGVITRQQTIWPEEV